MKRCINYPCLNVSQAISTNAPAPTFFGRQIEIHYHNLNLKGLPGNRNYVHWRTQLRVQYEHTDEYELANWWPRFYIIIYIVVSIQLHPIMISLHIQSEFRYIRAFNLVYGAAIGYILALLFAIARKHYPRNEGCILAYIRGKSFLCKISFWKKIHEFIQC